MKRPAIEYVLIGIGSVIFVVSLITAILGLGSYAVSIICSFLAILPFCLPWHRKRHPYVFLAALIMPILFCWIGIPQLVNIYKSILSGQDVFASLPAYIFIGFLNMQLFLIGTLIVTTYEAFHTFEYLKGRTSSSRQPPPRSDV